MQDVIVVGAGPTGLLLASELRLAGVSVRVLERLAAPTGLSKALGIGGRAVDLLDFRGLRERFLPARTSTMVHGRFAHFGGIPLATEGMDDLGRRALPVMQAKIEALLEAHALALGVELSRGVEVVGLRQDADGVTLDVHSTDGARTLQARWVVGCDGGRSAVRKLAGIAFPGTAPTRLFRFADVRFADGVARPDGLHLPDGRRLPYGVGGLSVIPLGDGIYRLAVREPYPEGFDRAAPVTLDELQANLRKMIGDTLPIAEALWLTRFTDASRQAEQYRLGRVFVAGDAAHVHLPAGGPGLNTGLQDAGNLGWKLAAEVNGWAPAGLLDSYHRERHPEGARVLQNTRAQGALMGATPDNPAMLGLREILADLLQEPAAVRRMIERLHTLNTRFEMDPATPAAEQHPLTGRWAPDLALTTARGPTRVAELMRRARGVLLVLSGGEALAPVVGGWTDRIDVVAARCEGEAPAGALLIRPDGFVAWAASAADVAGAEAGPSELRRALNTWFGAPRVG